MLRSLFKFALLSSAAFPFFVGVVEATTFNVANEADLVTAINAVNSTSGTHVINLTGNITLGANTNASIIPPILNSVTINGAGFGITGNSTSRLLSIGSYGTLNGMVSRPAVALNELTLTGGVASGGNGAGGGMGAGGAIFVGANADVTLSNVNFANNRAVGGAGAAFSGGAARGGGGLGGNAAAGGGGGFSGNGGQGGGGLLTAGSQGGGGYGNTLLGQVGTGGTGANALNANSGANGGGFNGGSPLLGQGGNGGFGGGGGAAGNNIAAADGGNGGYGGGGGAGNGSYAGGTGGYGGGGGAGGASDIGGNGGFGGGGGGSATSTAGVGGFGGGGGYGTNSSGGFGASAGSVTQGGGGAAFGGAIFVAEGGRITYSGNGTVSGGSVTAGTGLNLAQAQGTAMFFQGQNQLTLTPGAGNTLVINDTIVDQNGMASAGYAPPSGSFSGPERASLLISGAGNVTLAGNNRYSAGTIVQNGTVLSITDNSNLGTAASSLTLNNATLRSLANFSSNREITLGGNAILNSNGFTTTYSGRISGPGTLEINGGGQINLTASNNYSGGTRLNNTIVGINSDLSFGLASTPVVINNSTVVSLSNAIINRNFNVAAGGVAFDTGTYTNLMNGVIDGQGGIVKTGNGTLNLTNVNTYTGGTTIATGTLQLGDGTLQGSILGAVVNNGTLAVNSNGAQTIANPISGSGGMAVNGTGVITLTGNNTYVGTTNVNNGTLALGNGGTTGMVNSPIVLAPTGALLVNRSDNVTLTTPITGAGTVEITGGGRTTVVGLNPNFTGTTTVAQGSSLQLGNGTTNGTLGGNIVNNGALVFDQATTTTLTGNISGGGTLTQSGTGTVNLTGATTYTGTTYVTNGTLNVAGTLTGNVVNTGTGQVNVNGVVTGNVGNAGGTGNVTINPGSTVGTVTTNANSTTTVNGTVLGTTTVIAGSTLQGAGQVGSTTVNGTISPGANTGTTGTLTVNGALNLTTGSNYLAGITPTSNDRLNVSGATTLNGALNVDATAGTYSQGSQYTLLNSTGGVSGAFTATNIVGSFGDNIRPRVDIGTNAVTLVLSAERLTPFVATQNAFTRGLASQIDSQIGANLNRGALTPLYDLPQAQMSRALQQFSGEATQGATRSAGLVNTQFMGSVMESGLRSNAILDAPSPSVSLPKLGAGSQPFPSSQAALSQNEKRDGQSNTQVADSRYDKDDPYLRVASVQHKRGAPDNAVWGAMIGGFSAQNGNVLLGSEILSSRTFGVSGGVTRRVQDNLLVGFALSGHAMSSTTGSGLGTTMGEGISTAIYARINKGPLYLQSALSYGFGAHNSDRNSFNQKLMGNYSTNAITTRSEIGYRFGRDDVRFSPFIALQAQALNQTGFTERNNAGAAVGNIYAPLNATSWRGEIGMQWEKSYALENARYFTLRGLTAWGRELASKGQMSAIYAPLPAVQFSVPYAQIDKDVLLLSLGGEYHYRPLSQLFMRMNGEFSLNQTQIQAQAGLKSAF